MERAKTYVIRPTAFEAHEIRHHLHDIGSVKNPLYGLPVYDRFLHHSNCKVTTFPGIFIRPRIFCRTKKRPAETGSVGRHDKFKRIAISGWSLFPPCCPDDGYKVRAGQRLHAHPER